MSRCRKISTNTSTDKAFNLLGRQYGDFAAMLYLLMIPHAEDDGSLTADPDELLAQVVPMRRDKDTPDVEAALEGMIELGLIVRDADKQRVSFPLGNFYKYQTYIPKEKQTTAQKCAEVRETPKKVKEVQGSAQKCSSPSLSPSLSPSTPTSVGVKTPASPEKSARKEAKPTAKQKPPVDEFPPDDVPVKDLDLETVTVRPPCPPKSLAPVGSMHRDYCLGIVQNHARDNPPGVSRPIGAAAKSLMDSLGTKAVRNGTH